MNPRRLLRRLEQGQMKNVSFRDARRLAEALGFELVRVSGSHHIFARRGLAEMVNMQEVAGEAKPYQLRQLMRLAVRYDLSVED